MDAQRPDRRRAAFQQIGHVRRYAHRARRSGLTQPRRHLHGRAEKVVVLHHRLADMDPDTHIELVLRLGVEHRERPLHRARTGRRRRRLVERHHQPVAGMLDLAPAVLDQLAPHDGVVRLHHFHPEGVAKPAGHFGRSGDVGEHDGPKRRPRMHAGAQPRGIAHPPQEGLHRRQLHLDQVRRHVSV